MFVFKLIYKHQIKCGTSSSRSMFWVRSLHGPCSSSDICTSVQVKNRLPLSVMILWYWLNDVSRSSSAVTLCDSSHSSLIDSNRFRESMLPRHKQTAVKIQIITISWSNWSTGYGHSRDEGNGALDFVSWCVSYRSIKL